MFKSCTAYQIRHRTFTMVMSPESRAAAMYVANRASGVVVQLVRTLPCHGRGRGFESRRPRHILNNLRRIWLETEGTKGTLSGCSSLLRCLRCL